MFCHEVDINKWEIACVVGFPQKNIDFLNVSRLNVCACTQRVYISVSLQTIKKHLENNNFTTYTSSAVEVDSVEENVYVSIQNVNKGWNAEEAEVYIIYIAYNYVLRCSQFTCIKLLFM